VTPFKVRPFKRLVTGVAGIETVEVEGFINAVNFICKFYGLPFSIPAIEVGTDHRGTYAMIAAAEVDLGEGFRLVITPEFEEDEDRGCQISVERSGNGSLQIVSIYFDSYGNCNGDGRGEPVY